nr:M90 family metallopeptidase [Pseudomarimonas arenosa]
MQRHRRLRRLSAEDQQTLHQLASQFLADKTLSATHGLELTPLRAALLASYACLPVLHLGYEWLQGWRELIVYPGQFRVRRHEIDEHGVAHEWDDELAGEAWERGPVVVSWADVLADLRWPQAGFDVVVHEIAHKLDLSDGAMDGVPSLPREQRQRWIEVMQTAFDDLNLRLDRGEAAPIDDYAAEAPEEFFAVCSEYHFTAPQQLSAAYPAVAELMTAFYGRSPLATVPAA